MTVECPGCKTRFPVDARKVPDGGVHARCSVCSDVFFVEVRAPEIEVAPVFVPEDEPTGIGVGLPEAEVLEEEAEPAFEAPEPVEEAPEPVHEAPEAVEEVPEAAFEAPEAVEEAPEPAFEAPEAVEEAPEAAFEAPEAVEEAPEAAFEAPEAVEEAPEGAFEAPEAVEEAPEAAFEAPEAVEEVQKLPFELPAIASEEPGPLVPEPEPTFELSDIVTDERTFEDGARTFGEGETDFSMDSASFDTHVEVDEDTTPTFGDPSPTIEFTDIPGLDAPAQEETAWPEAEPSPEAGEATIGESEASTEAPAPGLTEPEPVFDTMDSLEAEAPSTLETPEPAVPEPSFPAPTPPPAPEPMPPLPTPHFGRRDPREKAQRLARVLVSDIILYNPDRHQRALGDGSLKEEFEDEIQKSWNEYVDQVGDEIANSTNYFNEALKEILAKGQPLF